MSVSIVVGLVMWTLLFASAFACRAFALRCQARAVSRNQRGTKWEQDVPMTECFEEDDDL